MIAARGALDSHDHGDLDAGVADRRDIQLPAYPWRVPRRNRRSDEGHDPSLEEERARRGVERVHASPDGTWLVRPITADGATKAYRCPGCDHEIAAGVAHVVAWPADERGDVADRRHWHTGCWSGRSRRGPTRRAG